MANGLDAQQDIFASNPDDRRAFEALEEHYFLDGDWDSLTDLYRTRLAAPGVSADPDQQSPLLFRLGQILEERILDLEGASEVYWTLARLDPTNRPALRQLRGLHTRAGKWDLVLQIAELESQTPMPPYERAAFETELGSTWQHHLGDLGEAQRAYERALEADPEYPPALEALAALHQDAGRHREAAEILTRLSERLRGPERAPVWVALGALLARALDEPVRARHCFERALEDDPFQAPAVEWSLLLAMADEDWEAVAELLERRFDLAAGARHRAAVAVEASQIQLNHLDSPAGARAWTDRAIELAPDEVAVLFAVADVERADGDRRALRKALEQLVRLGDPSVPREVYVEAAELHSELGDPEKALAAIGLAVERPGPDDGRVLALQARLLRESGSKRELAEVLETLTSLEGGQDERQRAEQLRELARLQEQDLGEEASAETTWQRAFDLDPSHRDAIDALDRIHRKHDDWQALGATLETALAATGDGPAGERLSVELGLVLLEHLDDRARARALFESALARDPGSAAALAGLRRLAEVADDPELLLEVCEREAAECSDGERMAELARAAIPILVTAGRFEDALGWAERWSAATPRAVDALQARVQLQARLGRPHEEIESHRKLAKLLEGRERAASLRRCATLQIQVGDDAAAAASLEATLEDEAPDRDTLEALAGVYRRMLRPSELAQTLRKLAEVLPPIDRAAPLEELASILQDPIGDLEAAIVVRWQLVDLDGAPASAHTRLEELLELAGRHEELAQLLHARRQTLGDETAEAFELDLRRGALLLDALGRGEDAARIFAALHERHPDDDAIVDQLERALRVGDDVAGLCDLLEQRVGWETDPARQRAMQLERASLLEEVLGEPLRACDLYDEILETHADTPEAATAATRLEALLEASGEWRRLRERLTRQLDGLDDEAQATLRERIAAICRDRLQDVAGCAEQLEAIAALAPDRVHVWQQLGEIYAHELDRPADWMRVVEAELATGAAPERERALRVAAARLLLDDDRRPADRDADEAYGHYERVLALHPTHAEAAEVLALHYAAVDRPEDTVRILERRLEGLGEAGGAEANDLRIRLGTLLSTTLREDSRAQEYFESARRELGAIPRIAEPLADLYERTGAFAELCALCQEAIGRESTGESELRWRMRLGASERRAGRPAEAATAYRAALERSPDDREIEDALIELYEELEETEPLAGLLEKRLPYASEEESIDLRLRLARLHADRRNEPNEALRHLEWILESHPQHRDAFDRALDVAERIGQPERILALVDRALDTPLANVERATLLERRAGLLADELDRGEAAITSLREVLALDRSRMAARRKLRAELEKLGRWPAALDCLFVEACEAEPDDRIALLEQGVEMAWTRIDPDAALPWLARLRAARPEDPDLLVRIADAHRRAGRFEAALRAHDDELALRVEPADRCALHLQRARLLERELGAPGRAIHAYQQALELATDRREILAELDRLYESTGRGFERADVLEARIELLRGDDVASERAAMRRTLATLYCVELAKPELAVPHLEANVAAARGDERAEVDALAALNRALRAGARHDEWARTAERELQLIEGDAELRSSTPSDYLRFLHEELARTYDVDLGAPDRAIDHLRALCGAAATSTPALRAQLRGLLRRTRRLPELAERLEADLEGDAATSGGEALRAGDWLELARLREEVLSDLPGALGAYRNAEADPALRLDAVRGRRRCCERLRDWSGLVEALEAELALDDRLDLRERITIARTLGDVAWQRLGSAERAAAGCSPGSTSRYMAATMSGMAAIPSARQAAITEPAVTLTVTVRTVSGTLPPPVTVVIVDALAVTCSPSIAAAIPSETGTSPPPAEAQQSAGARTGTGQLQGTSVLSPCRTQNHVVTGTGSWPNAAAFSSWIHMLVIAPALVYGENGIHDTPSNDANG